MKNRYQVTHSNKNKPGMSEHIFALTDTACNNKVMKKSTDLHELIEDCTERNTMIEIDCFCGGKIEMSRFHYKRLQEHDDVMCLKCEGN